MDIQPLLEIFDKSLAGLSGSPARRAKELLAASLQEPGRFDAQDEGLIEAILNDADKLFEKSIAESIDRYKSTLKPGEAFGAEDSHLSECVRIFIGVLENLVNYYYSALIRGQLG